MADSINVTPISARVSSQPVASNGSGQSAPQSVSPESTVKQVEATVKPGAAANSVEQAKMSAEKLQASVEQLNEFMKEGQRSLAFSVDSSADEVVVKITDRDTNELIRQIPTEEALAIREHLDKVMGMLFSEKV